MKITSEYLRERRKKLKITQQKMASLLGISFQTYNKYENNGVITKTKEDFLVRKFNELDAEKLLSDSVKENKPDYKLSDKNSQNGILENILLEIRELRKENEQLKNSITHYINLNEEEKKINELARKKLDLSVKALKSLDRELEEMKKSTGAKQNVGNPK